MGLNAINNNAAAAATGHIKYMCKSQKAHYVQMAGRNMYVQTHTHIHIYICVYMYSYTATTTTMAAHTKIAKLSIKHKRARFCESRFVVVVCCLSSSSPPVGVCENRTAYTIHIESTEK